MANWQRKKKKPIIYILPAAAVLIAALAALSWMLGWFSGPSAVIQVGSPGAAVFWADDSDAEAVEETVLERLVDEATGLLVESYRQADRAASLPAEWSGRVLASDQLLYGQYLLEQDKKKSFESWWDTFKATLSDDTDLSGKGSWRVDFSVLRLLAQSCTRWPDNGRLSVLQNLSDRLLAAMPIGVDYAAAVPTVAPITDFGATPTPKPTLSQPPEQQAALDVLRLASLDLFTMQQLAALDHRWQSYYDQYLLLVQRGYINDDLPLYAFGIDGTSGYYVNYSGVTPYLDTKEALLTLLHLCEVGQQNPRSINWLREQMLTNQAIYESYHIALGISADDSECLAGYAMVARIARITDDQALYEAAVSRLLWHQATSLTSDVQGAIFRQDENGRVYIYAQDNLWALLGLR